MEIPMSKKTRRVFVMALGCGILAACNSEIPDRDGDGFDEVEDCNDANAAVHPSAPEVCADGLDNDCDLSVDDGDTDCGGGAGS